MEAFGQKPLQVIGAASSNHANKVAVMIEVWIYNGQGYDRAYMRPWWTEKEEL